MKHAFNFAEFCIAIKTVVGQSAFAAVVWARYALRDEASAAKETYQDRGRFDEGIYIIWRFDYHEFKTGIIIFYEWSCDFAARVANQVTLINKAIKFTKITEPQK